MAEKGTATQTALENTSPKLVQPETLLDRIHRIHEAISLRAFDLFAADGWIHGRDRDNWFKAEAEILHPVHVHISESDDKLEVQAEVPGFGPKEVAVSVEPGRVTISGRKESTEERKKGKTVYKEHCSDEILRVLDLPAEVDAAKATAMLKNGVLSLSIPKAAQGNAPSALTKVEVKTA